MTSTITDRLYGTTSSLAVKAPARAATIASITLSGLQTIDGVSLQAGDRVLVKNQTNAVENGLYVARSSAWSRAADFDGAYDFVKGTQLSVVEGSTNALTFWRVTNASDAVLDEDEITFGAGFFNSAAAILTDTGETVQQRFDALFEDGPATAVTGVSFAADKIHDPVGDLPSMAGRWTNKQYWRFGINFELSDAVDTTSGGPSGTLFLGCKQSSATKAAAVTLMTTVNVTVSNGEGYALNPVYFAGTGLTGLKGSIAEFDAAPGLTSVMSPSFVGIPINCFNITHPVALQSGKVGAGAGWQILFAVYGMTASGVAFTPGAGETLGTFMNSGAATYNGPFVQVNDGHKVRYTDGSFNYDQYVSSHNLRLTLGANLDLRDGTDASTIFRFSNAGNLAVGANASAGAGYKLDVAADSNAEGTGISQDKSANGTVAMQTFVATGGSLSANGTAVKLRKNSSTSRSLDAAGTINASGADYAEYERKRDDCGIIAKGQIVGFDAEGLLTDKFALAVSFGVKSTNPNLVGGDDWSSHLVPPDMPVFQPAPYDGLAYPGPREARAPFADGYEEAFAAYAEARELVISLQGGADTAAFNSALADLAAKSAPIAAFRAQQEADQEAVHAQWEVDCEAFDAAQEAYRASVEAARAEWEGTVWADYLTAMGAFKAQVEEARAPVDRIAYCGKCPVNVTGAVPGQHIVPVDDGSGGIAASLVDDGAISFDQYRKSVGTIRSILPDGRALLNVRVA